MTDKADPCGSDSSAVLGVAAQASQHPYTYASTQATNCAGCGKYKHTPLRIDAMGGYVCLTCIDQKLGALLGEFGYPAPQEPLTDEQVAEACGWRAGLGCVPLPRELQIARAIELAHGIKAPNNQAMRHAAKDER
jgi:hypothetical protein